MLERTRKKPTLFDVAHMSGVSPATVSRVLHGNAKVAEPIRLKVEAALKELNYTRKPTPHPVRGRQATTIGLVVPDLSNPFFPLLIKGIENVAKMYDFSLMLGDSENSTEIEARLLETLMERRIDGLLFVPVSGESSYVTRLVDQSFPIVFVDRRVHDRRINAFTAANELGAYQAIQYLLSLGHRQILYIGGQENLITEQERLEGYKRALAESDIAFDEKYVVRGNYTWTGARDALQKVLQDGQNFSAIFAANDVMAFGAIQLLEQKGLSVPKDISVMGFDDIPFSELLSLTTVSQHPFEMGIGAMTMLIHLIQNRLEPPNSRTLMPSLIIRKSCRRHP